MIIPHFVQNELDVSDTDLAERLSAFNWCSSFDYILPFADGVVELNDMAHLWGLYEGIEVKSTAGRKHNEPMLVGLKHMMGM